MRWATARLGDDPGPLGGDLVGGRRAEAVMRGLILLGIPGLVIGDGHGAAQTVTREDAMRARSTRSTTRKTMQAWLSRVPLPVTSRTISIRRCAVMALPSSSR
jgi:hypothetical protein